MNNKTLKSLTHAHAWIGLIISIVLFVVFFAGSISLFRDNIVAWEKLPAHAHNVDKFEDIDVDYDAALKNISSRYDVYVDHLFYISPPTKHVPFIEVFFAKNIDGVDPITGEDHTDVNLMLDAETGEILGDASPFGYGNFIYTLHYDLGLGKIGLYFVGFITLFFFVAVLSGLVIHWRKLFKNFFQYRKNGNKDKWLDAHNIIGTMGLPFHVMYAFTGLVFNLLIIYQISYALILYQGDQDRLLAAAGYSQQHVDITNTPYDMSGINSLVATAKRDMGVSSTQRIMIEHFGDESARIIFRSKRDDRFATETEAHYQLSTLEQVYLTQDNHNNAVRSGLKVIASLHFGDFAGYGLRIAFFLLGLATCYVILTGNLLWIEKRAKQRTQSQRSLMFVRRMTSGGFNGVILAIAVGFILARLIPLDLINRIELIEYSVYSIVLACLISAQLIKNQIWFNIWTLRISALSFFTVILLDWSITFTRQLNIVSSGFFDIVITEAMLLTLGVICYLSARNIRKKHANDLQAEAELRVQVAP